MDHSENDKRFCVYVHKDADGNVRYVGSGLEIRAFQKSNRNKEHLAAFDFLTKEIISKNLSKSESEDLEQELITKYWETGHLLNKRKTVAKPYIIEYEIVSEFLDINTESPSGLSWKCNVYSGLNKPQVCAGDFAGSLSKSSGYYVVGLKGKLYLAHRLVWCLHNKQDVPTNLKIDHINNDKLDNSIDNLRLVNSQLNALNRKLSKNNTSGFQGVNWHSRDLVWVAQYSINGIAKGKYFRPSTLYPDLPYEEAKLKSLMDAVNFRNNIVESEYNRTYEKEETIV